MDKQIQHLSRLAKLGDIQAESQLLLLRMRTGDLNVRDIKYLVLLEYPAALLTGTTPSFLRGYQYSYGEDNIENNPVDKILVDISPEEFLDIGGSFIEHALDELETPEDILDQQNLADIIGDAIVLAFTRMQLEESESFFWRDFLSSDEFLKLDSDQALSFTQEHRKEYENKRSLLQARYDAISTGLEYTYGFLGAAVHSYLREFFESRYRTNRVACADYCRLSSHEDLPVRLEGVKKELAWQRDFLISYFLR